MRACVPARLGSATAVSIPATLAPATTTSNVPGPRVGVDTAGSDAVPRRRSRRVGACAFAWAWNDQHQALRPVHQSVSGAAEDKLRDRPPPPRPHHEQVHVRRQLEQ